MKRPVDMPKEDLVALADALLEVFFWDAEHGVWDPEKEAGADEIGAAVNVFEAHGLVPYEE